MGFDTSYYYWYGIELDIDTSMHYDLQDLSDEHLVFEVFGNYSSGEHTGMFAKIPNLGGIIGSSDYREIYPIINITGLYNAIDKFVLNSEHKNHFMLSKYELSKDYLDDFTLQHLNFILNQAGIKKIKTKGIFDWYIVGFGS